MKFLSDDMVLLLVLSIVLGCTTSSALFATRLVLGFVYTVYGLCYVLFKDEIEKLEITKHV